MSYDLYFYQEAGNRFDAASVRRYFAGQSGFQVEGTRSVGFQASYENKMTGVYCSFEYDELTEDDSAPASTSGFFYTGLYFSINFNRPLFFAMESMPFVQSVAERFHLSVGDPQEDLRNTIVPVRPSSDALVRSWEQHNTWAVKALHEDSNDESHYLYYPREKALYWWHYTREKDALQDRIEDDVFVPQISMIRKAGEIEVRSLVVWSDALPQVFPAADYVLRNLMAQDKAGEWYSKKKELLPWQWVQDEIRPLVQPCDGPVPNLVVVPSNRSSELRKIFNRLEGAAFKDYQFVGPDGFVDVHLPGKFTPRVQ